MPPQCESLDGPIAVAARAALEAGDPSIVLPYVLERYEAELKDVFGKTCAVRRFGGSAREVADRLFIETTVRLHRLGEGAPFTGMREPGGDPGPIIPAVEKAVATEDPSDLALLLTGIVRDELQRRFEIALERKHHAGTGVEAERSYIQALLGLEAWANKLYERVRAGSIETPHPVF
jgi:hypothetical protein